MPTPRKRSKKVDPELNPEIPNPYYTGTDKPLAQLERSSIRTFYWRDLNPALLAQECVNRGKGSDGSYRILGRVQWMERDGDGWLISCYLGAPVAFVRDWQEYRVTDSEVEAGKMLEVAA